MSNVGLGKGGRYCAVRNCSNGDYGLTSVVNDCNCRPPYELHNFPTRIKKPVDRQNWIHLLNRVSSSNKLWSPKKSSRVCSIHFIDRVPTDENPYPTENLGYNSKRKVGNLTNSSCNPRRRKKAKMSCRQPISSTKYVDRDHSYFSASEIHDEEETGNGIIIRLPLLAFQLVMFLTAFIYSSCVTNFIYILLLSCQQKFNLILILRTQVCSLRDENAKLKKRIECLQKKEDLCKCKLPIFEQLIKSDSDVNFYTGIPTISTFKYLQQFISTYVRHLWRGAKHTSTKIERKFKSTPNRLGPKRKLPGDDQFPLMWMKLRLNTRMRGLATLLVFLKQHVREFFQVVQGLLQMF